MKPLVAIVGGFLGAGKTTLILKAAGMLRARGVAVAAVLNDQGGELVDTELTRSYGVPADQVAGGCFCCRFPDLLDALERVAAAGAEVIFAEAVGSCADLVATTLRPLLRDYGGRYRVAPLTVLAHETPSDPELRFLFEHQVAEADLVIDRAVDVEGWVGALLDGKTVAAARSIAIDYARYAAAEAALGWVNARATARRRPAVSPGLVVGPLLDELDGKLTGAGIRIAHLKVMAQGESGYVKAAITGNEQEPSAEGMLDASPAPEHDVLINLRALGEPGRLETIVRQALRKIGAKAARVEAFRPAAPVPFTRIGG